MHAFAPYVRTVARGATLGRTLTVVEAEEAMTMVLQGRVEPVQLGALLMVLRYRTETEGELAGFVRAARTRIAAPAGAVADLDWPSYADRHKQLPYFLLATRLLAQAGVRVLLHGVAGAGAATTPKALAALGIAPAGSVDAAARQLERTRLAYLPLEIMLPELAALFDLRPLLGLRSPVNSLARELNPFTAPAQIQGVFHPNYAPLHAATALALGQPRAVVFKGGGGEAQRNPEKACRTLLVADGTTIEETWPGIAVEPHPWRKEPLEPARIGALWAGEWRAPGPEAAVIGTTAIALRLLGRAGGMAAAEDLARTLWRERLRARQAA